MNRLREFKEAFLEVLLVIKVCLTSFWFWLPPLFAAYMYFQFWIIFFIHPLTVLIVPVVFAVFAMILRERRIKAQYGLDKVKLLRASDPLGASPTWKKVRWDVEKAINEYRKSSERTEENNMKDDS